MGQDVAGALLEVFERTDFVSEEYPAMLKSNKQDQCAKRYQR